MGEQRAIRVPIDLPATLQIEERSIPCRIANISLGGVFVTGAMLPPETALSIRFTAGRDLELDCTTRWSSEDGVGLRFEHAAAEDIAELAVAIRVVLSRMA